MKTIILTSHIKTAKNLFNVIKLIDKDFDDISFYGYTEFKNKIDSFGEVKFILSTWNMPTIDLDIVKKHLPNLKAIFYAGGNINYFAKPFKKLGVKIYSYENINAIPVAEYTLAQILLANKGYFQSSNTYKSYLWNYSYKNSRKYTFSRMGNFQANIGLIGCGNIGFKLAKLLTKFDLNIYIYDPYISKAKIEKLGAKSVSLKEIFINCDIISNHLADTVQTKKMLDYSLFSLIKKNATFINTARGKQVVEKDLCKVMRLKPDACALLDVTSIEPILPTSCLLRRKNIFITPHISGSNPNEFKRIVISMLNSYNHCKEKLNDI